MNHFARLVNEHKNNPIIKEFLKDPDHYQLLHNHLYNPTLKNKKKLDEAFREFFLEIRFTTYILSLIHFASIDFDKKVRNQRLRNALVLVGDTHHVLKDFSNEDSLPEANCTRIEEIATSSVLFDALKLLTEKEKNVLIDAYLIDMTDTSIAKKNNVSQQAISKIRTRALKKLKSFISDRKGLST